MKTAVPAKRMGAYLNGMKGGNVMEAQNRLAMPVYFMRLHDLLLTVVEHDGERYVPLRPVVDMLRLSWKRAHARAMEAVLAANEAVAPAENGQTGGVLPLERGKNAVIQEGDFPPGGEKTPLKKRVKKRWRGLYQYSPRLPLYRPCQHCECPCQKR